MTRKNRRDPENEDMDKVWEHPELYTRETRRAAGHRGAVSQTIGQLNADKIVWPRRVRRAAVFNAQRTKSRRARQRAALVLRVVTERFMR
jgi:hypothetical protein